MKKSHLFLVHIIVLFILLSNVFGISQPQKKDRDMFGLHDTRGLTITSAGLADGYIMFVVPNSASTYLINRKGEVVKEWKGREEVMGAYLGDDGSLVQNAANPGSTIYSSQGEAGRIQKISWDNEILWDFEYAGEDQYAHHDFCVMPNGHILAIAWEAKSTEEALAKGYESYYKPKTKFLVDKIIEIAPKGEHGGEIVWEWHIWDHLFKRKNSTEEIYDNTVSHPELFDIQRGYNNPIFPINLIGENYGQDILREDLFHLNAIKYNPALDQIVFSSPVAGEIYIIDHSTTSKEAVGHTGGKRGKGGDILYRWGAGKGDEFTKQLYGQHDVRWIEEGKPGAGHLIVFNNNIPKLQAKYLKLFNKEAYNKGFWGTSAPWEIINRTISEGYIYSSVYELSLPIDRNGNYKKKKNKPFGPNKPIWTYTAPDSLSFYSSFISGAHRMHNGNTFINEGAKGRFFEVAPNGEIVWEYLNPYRGDIYQPTAEPASPIPTIYSTFRATFIPADHPGLVGRKLEPLDPQPQVFVLPSRK